MTSASSEIDALRLQLGRKQAELDSLNVELAETNNGVVALYVELDDRAEQLRQASDLKSRFLSYMSHEFRTPLGSISNLTGILLSHLDAKNEAVEAKRFHSHRAGPDR